VSVYFDGLNILYYVMRMSRVSASRAHNIHTYIHCICINGTAFETLRTKDVPRGVVEECVCVWVEGVRFWPPGRSARAAGVGGVRVRAAVSAVSHCLAVGPLWRRRGRGERTVAGRGGPRANVGVFLDKRLTSSNNQ